MGRYQLIRKLATGGMAEVFLAKAAGPMGFEKTLVVKRILPHLAEDPEFVGMFLSEAKLAALLNHANVAQIFDFGHEDGAYFIAMEYIDGPNLRVLLRRAFEQGQPLPFPLCARILSLACDGLAHAHELAHPETGEPLHLVHRDISPDNIMLSRTGGVKVVDFGIAKATVQAHRTQTGLLKGKLAYMSPEHLLNEPLDLRADIYSLGVVLYELVTGQKPFDAPSEVRLMQAILQEPPVDVGALRRDVPAELEVIVQKALAKDRKARYASCRELQVSLDQYLLECGQSVGGTQIAELVHRLAPPPPSGGVPTAPPGGDPPPPPSRSAPTSAVRHPIAAQAERSTSERTVGFVGVGAAELPPSLPTREHGEPRSRAQWKGWVGGIGLTLLVGGGVFLAMRPSTPSPGPEEKRTVQDSRASAPAPSAPPAEPRAHTTARPVPPAPEATRPGSNVHGVAPAAHHPDGPRGSTKPAAAPAMPPPERGQGSPGTADEPEPDAGTPGPIAHLEVISTPRGRVRLNGRFVGTSPVKTSVPAGPVHIELSGTDFRKVETVVLEAGDEVTRTIVLEKGWLQIRGRPEEAVVTLDGRELGAQPESQEVYEGSHRLEVVDPETQKRAIKECTVQPHEYKLCKFDLEE